MVDDHHSPPRDNSKEDDLSHFGEKLKRLLWARVAGPLGGALS